MKTFLFTVAILFIFVGIYSDCYSYRTAKPIPINEINPTTLVELNSTLEELWFITNGRYHMNSTTSNPDGTETGTMGDFVLFNDSGTYYLEINVDGGTTWHGTQLSDTP